MATAAPIDMTIIRCYNPSKELAFRLVLIVEDVLNRNDDCKRHCDYFKDIFYCL